MSKATGETEHLKDMLVGNILAVSYHTIVKTAIVRTRFLAIRAVTTGRADSADRD